jgi:YVTN family beta-propeller protein
MKLHPDNRHLYCLGEYVISVADCASREVTAEARGGVLSRMVVHPSTGLAYCADYGNERVRVVDTAGQVIRDIWTASDIGTATADDARGLVYLADRSQYKVLVFDAATAEPLAAVPVDGRPDVFCLNPCAPKLYCARYNDKLAVIDLELMTLDTVIQVDDDPDNLRYDPATNKLYVACEGDDVIDVVDGATYETIAVLPAAESPRAMCMDTIAGRLFCCLARTDEVLVVDTRADTIITRLAVGNSPRTLCLDPARRRVYCANHSGNSVTVIDAVELRVIGAIDGLGRYPAAVALDPALGRLYCATTASIDVIDCHGDSLVQRIPFGGIRSAALDRSHNSLFVIETDPRRVVALDAATGEETRSWDTLYYPYSIAYGENSDQLYVVSSSSRLLVLDKPALEQPISSPTGPVLLKSELTLLGTKRATVHDITGRKVADFAPGRNDLTRLPAGIYFIRREGEQQTAKVVVTR